MKKLILILLSLLFLISCFPSKKAHMLEPQAVKSIKQLKKLKKYARFPQGLTQGQLKQLLEESKQEQIHHLK